MVSESRIQTFDGLYQYLGTNEEEKYLYRIAKGREIKTRHLNQVKCVKDEEGKVLVQEKDIKYRWKTYFYNLFNEGNDISPYSSRIDIREVYRNYNYNCQIQKQEVKESL